MLKTKSKLFKGNKSTSDIDKILSKDDLKRMYINENKSSKDIANIIGCNHVRLLENYINTE